MVQGGYVRINFGATCINLKRGVGTGGSALPCRTASLALSLLVAAVGVIMVRVLAARVNFPQDFVFVQSRFDFKVGFEGGFTLLFQAEVHQILPVDLFLEKYCLVLLEVNIFEPP